MSDDRHEHGTPRFSIAIVGAGALGLSFAARLGRVTSVAVIARGQEQADALRDGVDVGAERVRFAAFAPPQAPHAEFAVILVKARDTENAARAALACDPRAVLSLQNGLVEDRLRAVVADCPCAQGTTTAGAWRDGARIVPTSVGETLVPPGFETVAALLTRAGLPARVDPDIRAARLAKLLVNLAVNPVTALFRVPNGALARPPHRGYVEALIREAWPVLRAEGLALDEAQAYARVFDVIAATADNRSSMLQDVLAGRPTELDALTAAFLPLAAAHGAHAPTHAALCHLLGLPDGATTPKASA